MARQPIHATNPVIVGLDPTIHAAPPAERLPRQTSSPANRGATHATRPVIVGLNPTIHAATPAERLPR